MEESTYVEKVINDLEFAAQALVDLGEDPKPSKNSALTLRSHANLYKTPFSLPF